MVVRIAGKRMYLWRAVDHEGEVLDMLVQRRRDKRAALRLMRKLLRRQGFVPKLLTTDKLGSYGSAVLADTSPDSRCWLCGPVWLSSVLMLPSVSPSPKGMRRGRSASGSCRSTIR